MSDPKPHPKMTGRQAREWPVMLAEAERHVGYSVDASPYRWLVEWAPESRRGRGHDLSAIWADADYYVVAQMDVYGRYIVVVAELRVVHNSSDEECQCGPCEKERDDEGSS